MFKIIEKLRPFSHVPGATCTIPGTTWELEAFPTLLRFGKIEHRLELTGPVHGFTVQQDLEKDCVYVFGTAKEGFFRICIRASDEGFVVRWEKGPKQNKKEVVLPAEMAFVSKPSVERLSLGNHKMQDWELLWRRLDLTEILPILFCLGQKIPFIAPQPLRGTARLLEIPEDRTKLAGAITTFLQAAFTNMLIPRLVDDQHQGLVPEEEVSGDRYFLVQEGAKMVRGLFFREVDRRLSILPALPVPFAAGRMMGIQAPGVGEVHIEWSKKILRRMVIKAMVSGEIVLDLQKGISRFRLRHHLKEKGHVHNAKEPLLLEAHKTYLFDRIM